MDGWTDERLGAGCDVMIVGWWWFVVMVDNHNAQDWLAIGLWRVVRSRLPHEKCLREF